MTVKDPYGKLEPLIALFEDSTMLSQAQFEQCSGDGLYTVFYLDGKPCLECMWLNGVLNGKAKTWYPSGDKKQELIFVQGKRSGPYISWHANGQTESLGVYKDGEKTGLWKSWDQNGEVLKKINYSSDS